MRFHLLGLAHTKTNRDYMPCAYTQKVYKLARMLTRLGHEIIHYGAEGSEVPCEHVSVVTDQVQRETYANYDWHSEFFRHDPNDYAYQTFNANAIQEIEKRKCPDDFLLVSFGKYQKPIADSVKLPLTVELGIGYTGVFAKFRIFESYAWMHYIYGMTGQENGGWYDAVIPNFFEAEDFTLRRTKLAHLAYLGRLIECKGVQTAIAVAREVGLPLMVAGQGSLQGFNTDGATVGYLGTLNASERNAFLGGAQALLVPTYYIEPFGGVAVEAQFCGTPVVTTDWGAFSETVWHGVTGWRCRTLDDFCFAVSQTLNPDGIRKWAVENYSTDRIAMMYNEYFMKLADLFRSGWYEKHPDRDQLNWLIKTYPSSLEEVPPNARVTVEGLGTRHG